MLKNNIFRGILLFMGVIVDYPNTLNVDNGEDILPSDNTPEYQWNNHLYVRHHLFWDYVEDRTSENKICLFSRKNW